MTDDGVVRMALFHLRSFARTSFFVQLTITSTLSMVFLQALGVFAYGDRGTDIWLRAGMVGCWATSTVAAGIIGFQRFQGTLPYLLMSPRPASQTILPLVASASLFGLIAFALSAAASWLLGIPLASLPLGRVVVGVFAFWLGCLAISCVVAAVFVLSPNAITYEELLMVPLILLSGIFALPISLPPWLEIGTFLLPTRAPAQLLLNADADPLQMLLLGILSSTGWFVAARIALARALTRATRDATLEVV